MALHGLLQQLWQWLLHYTAQFNPFTLSVILLFSLLLLLNFTRGTKLKLPPSPPKLPIIGNLHQLGTLPHRSFRALSEKYGPLMLLNLGQTPTLVIQSAEMAREMMKTHDLAFSNRPKTTAANIFLYGCVDVGFAPYGEYWRQARKICVLELLSLKRVQSFQFVREEEVEALVNKIRQVCLSGASINLSDRLFAISNNIVSRCVFGRKSEDNNVESEFGKVLRRFMGQFMAFSFGDMFPYLGWIDVITGFIGSLKSTFRSLDALLDEVIEEHKSLEGNDEHTTERKDIVHILLQLQKAGMLEIELTRDNIKAILLDMFVGGTDTTSTALEWAMAELIKNPRTMKKAQEEVRRVVGQKSKIEDTELNQMGYLKCVVKETLRLHPPAALLVPRETSESIKFLGYDIPAKTRVFVNAWAIQRDPKLWERPEDFLPDRFVNSPIDFQGQDFQFIPFGGGRRGCPGMSFGVVSLEYLLANLLYWFSWELPGGTSAEDLDMSEVYGLTVSKKIPLQVVPVMHSP